MVISTGFLSTRNNNVANITYRNLEEKIIDYEIAKIQLQKNHTTFQKASMLPSGAEFSKRILKLTHHNTGDVNTRKQINITEKKLV